MKRIILLCFILLASCSYAQRVGLDLSFGDSGVVSAKVKSYIHKIVSLPNGKMLCLGEYLNDEGTMQPTLFKFNCNGSLDSTFNEDGILQDTIKKLNNFPGNPTAYNFMTVQPDGRIYMAGSKKSTSFYKTYISCNDSNGNPILTFGKSGVLMLDTIENLNRAFLAGFSSFQDNGIIACWYGYYTKGVSSWGYILRRFDSNGSVVRSFGTDGSLFLNQRSLMATTFSIFHLENMIVLKDSSIVCAGSDMIGNVNNKSTLIKLNPDGTFNDKFGMGGKAIIDVDTCLQRDMYDLAYLETARNVIELEDHRLIVTSNTEKNNGDHILRLMPDGSLDKTFGNNGISKGLTCIYDVAVLNDRSIVACNWGNFTHFFQNGMVDSSMIQDIPFPISCAAIQDDHRIIFGGFGYQDFSGIAPFLARLNSPLSALVPEIILPKNKVSIYPVPFKDVINFRSDKSLIFKITIYDLNGRMVLNRRVNDQYCILQTDLAKGVYQCKIETFNGIEFHKIVSIRDLE